MSFESPNYQINNLNSFVINHVLKAAQEAVSEGSYGVGGVLVNLQNGAIIKTMHNTVIAAESSTENPRLKDATAHGERQLIDWYYANKLLLNLPEAKDILIVTSLDPCFMCTGSILSAGFRVVVVALDDNAGINWDNSYEFRPLEGKVLEQAKNTFIYPRVIDDAGRNGYGATPLFTEDALDKTNVQNCFQAFIDGANIARSIVKDINGVSELIDLSKDNSEIAQKIKGALKAVYQEALNYKTENPRVQDERLADYLAWAANKDIRYGGDGDAVAFIDYFGNLLMCMPGKKSESPIRTAFMETTRAYQGVRYNLYTLSREYTNSSNSPTYKGLLKYLCDPSQGVFVFAKGFDKSAQSFADLGAYGSVMLNAPQEGNLQYLEGRISQADLTDYISGMPKRYAEIIKPQQVTNGKLIEYFKKRLDVPKGYTRYIDIPFPQGFYLTACVSMQTALCITARLFDDQTSYFSFTQQSTKYKPYVLTELKQIKGSNLCLDITIDGPGDYKNLVKFAEQMRVIKDGSGNEKAWEYTIFVEDAQDDDYNDLYITLTAWKSIN
jgi:cytosine deaminase